MELSRVIEVFIASLMVGMYFSYSGSKIFKTKINRTFHDIIIILLVIAFTTVNYLFLDNVAKMLTLYIVVMFSYKLLYKRSLTQCAAAALISYFLIFIGEISFTLLIVGFHSVGLVLDISNFMGSIIANLIVCLVALLFFFIIRKTISKFVLKLKENNTLSLIFTFVIMMLAISSIFYKIAISKWVVDSEFLLNILMIICLIVIGVVIIKQHIEKVRISEAYERNVEYSKQSEKLIEQYSISQHENKNELIIIRSMVHKNNTNLLDYLNEIIKSKDNIENAWIKHLRYIPFGGLKGIMHNKISEMMDHGINVFVNVSKNIEKSKLKDLSMKENSQLSKIISVFLDNAREASLNSDSKESSVSVYLEKETIFFEIANSFSGNIDINNIYNSGYSSKGKNRGYGLTIVKNIIDENNIFENVTEIKGEYFIQIIKIRK